MKAEIHHAYGDKYVLNAGNKNMVVTLPEKLGPENNPRQKQEERSDDTPLSCGKCGKEFDTRHGLSVHQGLAH